MSLLDPIFQTTNSGGAADIAELQAGLAAQQAIAAAHETELNILAAQLDGLSDAQAAVDAIQTAAIAANEAVNTAQAAALAAQAASDATQTTALEAANAVNAAQEGTISALVVSVDDLLTQQTAHTASLAALSTDFIDLTSNFTTAQSAIASLQARVTFASEFYVGAFTSGGEPLTQSNFEAAFLAALAAAHAACDAPQNNDAYRGSAAVYVPPGNWPMTDGVFIIGQYPKTSPSIIGMGPPGSVVLRFPNSANFPGIGIGINPDGTIQTGGTYALGVVLQNIDVYAAGGVAQRGGVRARNTLVCTVRHVTLRGFGQQTGPWHERVGFDFRNNNVGETPTAEQNHQHLYMERCTAAYALIGIWLGEGVWSATLIDNNLNGCEYPAIYEGAVVGWFGGNCQGGTHGARHNSGAMYTTGLPSGTGASITAAVDGLSTVSGLAGLLGVASSGSAVTHKSCWLTLGDDIYRIADVLDADECTVRRSSGAAASDLAWSVRGCGGGNEVMLTGQIYHEGTSAFYLDVGTDFSTASYWRVESVQSKIADAIVNAVGCAGKITLRDCRGAGALAARLNQCKSFETDRGIDEIDSDAYSRSGIVARYPGGAANVQRGVWDARPRAGRYTSALRERGAAVFDARKLASVVRSGLDVTGWTDITGAVTLPPLIGGVYPQWEAFDAGLGAPAIRLTAAGALDTAGLAGDIGSLMPAGVHAPSLIVVARMPDVTTRSAQTRRIMLTAAGFDSYIGFFDNGHHTSGVYSFTGGTTVTPDLVAVEDTDAHWAFASRAFSGREQSGAGSDVTEWVASSSYHGNYRPGVLFPTSLTLSLLVNYGTSSGELLVSHVAVLPAMTEDERQHFLDLARGEFPIAAV